MKSRVWCFVFGVLLCGQVAWGTDWIRLEPVGEMNVEGRIRIIEQAGSHAVLLIEDRFDDRPRYTMSLIDISDAARPQKMGSLTFNQGPIYMDMAVAGEYAYVVAPDGLLVIIDLSDPTTPTMLGEPIEIGRSGQSIWLSSETAYISGESLVLFDISDPANPLLLGASPQLWGGKLVVRSDYAYIAAEDLIIMDVSDSANVRLVAKYAFPDTTSITIWDIARVDGDVVYLYSTCHDCGRGWGTEELRLVDVTVPSQPEWLRSYNIRDRTPLTLAASNIAFISSDTGPLVLNVSDPASPTIMAHCGPNDAATVISGLVLTAHQTTLAPFVFTNVLQVYRITEVPAITRQSVQNGKLNLQWNEPARGMKLQRATSLENPEWQDLPGSETMTSAELQVWGGPEYFRLAFDAPENMVWIPAGTFMMGSPETEQDRNENEGPQTQVTLTQGFFMGKYEVTQGEYLAVMGENPSWFNGDRTADGGDDYGTNLDRPVEQVSWDNAVAYCGALTEQERVANRIPIGYAFRLPTEAEWEYCCRAGTTTRFSYGDDPDFTQLGEYAWYSDNSGDMTHSVGQKLPNQWGLFDMHGNVWEWCQDWSAESLPGGIVLDPQGPDTGPGPNSTRVMRGGDWGWWKVDAKYCRSAHRNRHLPEFGGSNIGFRVVLAPARP
jgi:formylglycine-generating enzyme required for sulfatase activity